MKKFTYKEMKKVTKTRVNDRFGDALLIILIPSVIVFILSLILQTITAFFPPLTTLILNQVFSYSFSFVAAFVSSFMLIRFARGRDGFSFEGLFEDSSKIKNFLIYMVATSLISFLALFPIYDFIFNVIPTMMSITDPIAINDYVITYINTHPNLSNNFLLAYSLLITFSLIMLKFTFTPFLIVDKGLSVIEAMKKSWKLTHGNYFRILFFPFTFFFWFLLGIITCGIGFIYVIPLIRTGYAYLYLHILKENRPDQGYNEDEVIAPPVVEVDPLAMYE